MRDQLVPDNPNEEQVLKVNPVSRVLFDPFLPVMQARALMAAVRNGIIEFIGQKESCSAEEISDALSLDVETVTLLLRISFSAGYVDIDDGSFSLSDLALATLLPQSPMKLSAWVEFNYIHWDIITKLDTVLQTGKGYDPLSFLKNEKDWKIQQQAMLETARPVAPWIASQVPIRKDATRLLDIGGSHGLYGAMICREHPPMRSEVIELPDAVEFARALAQQEKIADVVTHRAGNVLFDDLGDGSFDAFFLGNIVHHLSPAQNLDLLIRMYEKLKPGGTVAVWDFNYPKPDSPPDLITDAFALLFRISSRGRCHSLCEIVTWMETAGFSQAHIINAPTPTHALITARKW